MSGPQPQCDRRNCKHFMGLEWLGAEEDSETPVCAAFPKGIPDEIAFGDDLHLEPVPGDHGIQFERA